MKPPPLPENFFSQQRLADRWDVSVKTVGRLIARGDLRHVRVGGQIRIRPEDVAEYEAKGRK